MNVPGRSREGGDDAPRGRAQPAIAALLIGLAAFVFWQVQRIPADGGYSAVGPRFTPMLIAAGLLIVGGLLLWQAWSGGWKGMEGVAPPEPFFAPAFAKFVDDEFALLRATMVKAGMV